MPNNPPPRRLATTTQTYTLLAGTPLFRVHVKGYTAESFNPTSSHRYYGGGRFDSTDDDRYAFSYAGQTVDVALAETLLRDIPVNAGGARFVPRARFADRRLSAVETTRPLKLVDLRDVIGLGRAGQDSWLVHTHAGDYAQTRHWAHWIRSREPTADGFVWMSHRQPTQEAYVLFAPVGATTSLVACAHPTVPAGPASDFDTRAGRSFLRARLNPFGFTVRV